MVPMSVEVFLSTLSYYNQNIWPLQILTTALGLGVVWSLLSEKLNAWKPVAIMLAAGWIWTGAFYHLRTFSDLNFWDYPLGLMLMAQGLLLIWTSARGGDFALHPRTDRTIQLGAAIGIFALLCSPLLSWATGNGFAQAGYFATSPGPTILFSIGILLAVTERRRLILWCLPLLAALPVTILGVTFGLIADIAVLPIALLALVRQLQKPASA